MRLRIHIAYLVIAICMFATSGLKAQTAYDSIIQIDGVAMTADSLRGVSNVTVIVKNKNRGVISAYTGVFSLVCYKGDTLDFSSVGYRAKEFVVPADLKGQYFSLIQLMVQDTFYLPETIIKALPTRQAFDYAFQYWHVPADQLEIARRNTNKYTMRSLAYTLPRDGAEMQSMTMKQMAADAVYYGQQKPMNIFNPLAWADFFNAWKRGDFRSSNNPYNTNNY